MAYNPTLSSLVNFQQGLTPVNTQTTARTFATVVDIVLDSSHPDYEAYGKLEAINGIRYKVIGTGASDQEPSKLPFAYYGETSLKKVPLIDEIVEIVNEPTNTLSDGGLNSRVYYTKVVNLWNNTHHNALPILTEEKTNPTLGKDIQEVGSIANLQPFPGDTYLEGRLGQSLRMSGFTHPKNSFTDSENNGSPFSILRVGQNLEADIFEGYVEDVNADSSSIYLMSKHTVPVELSTTKQDSFRDEPPTSPLTFQGKQIVADSGRIVVHAKEDSLFLNSKNSISLGGNSINMDGLSYISLDANTIFLGSNASQPAVLGNSNNEFLNTLLQLLKSIGTSLGNVKDATQVLSALSYLSPQILKTVEELENKLESLKSNKVIVE